MHVKVTSDDKAGLDRAIKEFSKRVKKSGILNELRDREYYLKPSKQKLKKRQESIKRRKREERKATKTQKYDE